MIHGGKWDRRKHCMGCGYRKDRKEFSKGKSECKECERKRKNKNSGETNEENQKVKKEQCQKV